MFGKVMSGLAVAALLVACGPAASLNGNEGNSCNPQNDNCGGDLNCQPVEGRSGMYCCPTPTSSSTHANCQPVQTSAPS
jgi:hypothetical protein